MQRSERRGIDETDSRPGRNPLHSLLVHASVSQRATLPIESCPDARVAQLWRCSPAAARRSEHWRCMLALP